MKRTWRKCMVWLLILSFCIAGVCPADGTARALAAVSTQSEENAPEISEDAVWLNKNATGSLGVTMKMPQLYYTAEEDEALSLDIWAEGTGSQRYTFSLVLEEWTEYDTWQEIVNYNGPGGSVDENDVWHMSQSHYHYFRKGRTYRFVFRVSRMDGATDYDVQYSFHKTANAGCENGVIWRKGVSECNPDDTEEYAVIEGYEGDEAIWRMPSEIGGYPVRYVELRFQQENNNVQVVMVDAPVMINYGFDRFPAVKDVYLMNDKINLMNTYCYADDFVIHCYAGGGAERECKGNRIPYQILGEETLHTPEPTAAPTASPKVTPNPKPLPTAVTMSAIDCLYRVNEQDEVTILKYTGSAQNLVISRIDGMNVTAIAEGAFQEKKRLRKVELPDTLREIGEKAFYESGIESIALPESVEKVGKEAFSHCYSLTAVQAGDHIREWGCNALDYTAYMDDEANWKDDMLIVGGSLILYRGDAEILTIPEGITTLGDYFIPYSPNMRYVFLPKSLYYIGEGAFAMTSLMGMEIAADDLRVIGKDAFFWTSIRSLYLSGDSVEIQEGAFRYSSVHSLQIAAKNVIIAENGFKDSEKIMDMLVLPDLTKDICNFLKNGNGAKQLAFTNVSAGQFEKILKENGGADLMEKADAVYVPFAREELSDPDLLEDSNVFYQGEWHLVRYMMQNHAEEIYAVRDGETCPLPGMADVYSYPPIGTVLYHKGYDLNGDGEPDELPEKVTEDLVIQCLYDVAEKEHTWELVDTTYPDGNCEEPSESRYRCSGCRAEKTEQSAALGHDYEKEWTVDLAATCTQAGIKSHHCRRSTCDKLRAVTVIPSLGHQWDNGVVTKQPSAKEKGIKTYTCRQCGETRTEEISWTSTPQPTKLPETKPPAASMTPVPVRTPEQSAMPSTEPTRQQEQTTSSDGDNTAGAGSSLTDNALPAASVKPASSDKKNRNSTLGVSLKKSGGISRKTLSAPVIRIQKKKQGKLRYLVIKLTKYQGDHVQISYRKKKTGAWVRLAMKYDTLKKKEEIFRICYLSTKGSLYVKVRTWKKSGSKRVYSAYSRQKQIRLTDK